MSAPVEKYSSSFPPSLTTSSQDAPSITTEQPFDRDGVRWIPFSMRLENEVCSFEVVYEGWKERLRISGNLIGQVEQNGLKFIVINPSLDQNVICVPFRVNGLRKPCSFVEFQDLIKDILAKLDPESFKALEFQEIPNLPYLTLQIKSEPTIVEQTVRYDEKKEANVTTQVRISGTFMRGYVAEQGIYILIDKSDGASLNPRVQTFVSSFKRGK